MSVAVSAKRIFTRAQMLSYAAAALGIEMVWATLIGFLPPMLEQLGATPRLIGLLLSVAPITGLLVQPFAGFASDSVQTRWGRRLPFLLAGAPCAALALCGLAGVTSLVAAALFLAILCISINAYQ